MADEKPTSGFGKPGSRPIEPSANPPERTPAPTRAVPSPSEATAGGSAIERTASPENEPKAPEIPPGQSTAQGGVRQQTDANKDKGSGLKTLEAGKTYKLREGGATAWWWRRKHDGLPQVTVIGKVKDVLGVPAGELRGNHHIEQLKDRTSSLPANHPVAKDWDDLYIASVRGSEEMVHASEVEAL